jgi:hypothetical protein
MVLGIFLFVILFSFLKGGKGLDSIVGIEQCSGEFWGIIVAYAAVMA